MTNQTAQDHVTSAIRQIAGALASLALALDSNGQSHTVQSLQKALGSLGVAHGDIGRAIASQEA